MDPDSGDIFLVDKLDFETATDNPYNLTIIAVDSDPTTKLTGTVDVHIHVEDVNDNSPVCNPFLYLHDLSESTVVSSNTLLTLSCSDVESSLAYTIVSVKSDSLSIANPFAIDNSGAVRLSATVDYETHQAITALIQVADTGSPSRSVTATIEFDITNVNDNAPVFSVTHYNTSIIETTAVGSKIYNVTAADADVADVITYEILPVILEFEIDPRSGEIFLKKAVNYDGPTKSYELVVLAKDDGTDPSQKTGTATVTVFVTNFNDGTPEFDPGVYIALVNENAAVGDLVTTVTVVDIDDATFTYRILSGNSDGIFRIDGTTNIATITVDDNTSLDFETTVSYTLVIEATDAGGLFGTATVNIEITNYNEHAPVFTTTQNTVSVAENAAVGTSVLDIDATDADHGIDGVFRFSITSGAQGKFSINPITGLVNVSGALDIETKNSYTLVITAKDSGTNPGMFVRFFLSL